MDMAGKNVNNSKCLVSTLTKLRESSKDAVVSADSTDAYIMYMHVDRPVQEAFVSILKKTYDSPRAQLILLCGSVGDGKSHMLSYCREVYPDMMKEFYIHNDSSASLYVDKPASYTLNELMEEFTDERLSVSTKKVILAINLGTLSNFIEADVDNRFQKLKAYVDKAGVLETHVGDDVEDENFHCVNFADYHLFELTKDGPKSDYIQGILSKITCSNNDNVFYDAYCRCCHSCENSACCPVKINYEMIGREEIQKGIIRVLVETIIKNKLIISTRTLLNFLYEIMVDERCIDRGSLEPQKESEKINTMQFCEGLLPNMLFGRHESSDVLSAVGNVDPMRIRNEAIDDFFVYYENFNDILDIFKSDLKEYSVVLKRLENINFGDSSTHPVRESVLRLFVRLCWLTQRRRDLLSEDADYSEYMIALFNWNNADYKCLKDVYNIVERGVLAWNGPVEKNEMRIPINDKKTNYHLIQEIQIKALPESNDKDKKEILYSFRDELKLKYKYGDNRSAELDVDYTLYSLLKRVIHGYIPSLNDKRVNVKCMEFIKKISGGGKKLEALTIRDLSHKETVEFLLEYSDSFGYSFEVK